jgi:hypothetical protein
MCSKIRCRKCGKPTWSGCGNHIEEALEGIPVSQRCQGHDNDPKQTGLFRKIFGRK